MRYLWVAFLFVASTAVAQNWQQVTQSPRPAHPKDYYPKESVRRGEQGSATVKVCVDSSGKLLRAPVITVSSGFWRLDEAVIKIANDSRYGPGMRDGVALPESCREYPVTFREQSRFPESPGVEAKVMKPANPDDYYPRATGSPRDAAIEVAKATRYAPGRIDGVAAPESCVKFKVRL
jgi:TonB family protein